MDLHKHAVVRMLTSSGLSSLATQAYVSAIANTFSKELVDEATLWILSELSMDQWKTIFNSDAWLKQQGQVERTGCRSLKKKSLKIWHHAVLRNNILVGLRNNKRIWVLILQIAKPLLPRLQSHFILRFQCSLNFSVPSILLLDSFPFHSYGNYTLPLVSPYLYFSHLDNKVS